MLASMGSRGRALIATVCALLSSVANAQPRVALPSGEIEGAIRAVKGYADSNVFYGIPYAGSPVGQHRFRSPRPVSPWSGVRDASKPGPTCMQPDGDYPALHFMGAPAYNQWEVSEDCLTLDVYARSLTGKQPVIVYIHGGGFQAGTSSTRYDFSAYSSVKGIVTVAIQYRLGALGWVSMQDENLPGNMGFQDQVQALKWVQENIKYFGGDPDQVTLIGQSAGGDSVTMHIVSPMSSGLFKRAIVQSGSVVQTRSFPPIHNNTAITLAFAECLGCPTEDSYAMVECFRKLPAERFVVSKSGPCKQSHLATVDGTFIPDDPEKLLRTGQYNKDIDVIMGNMQNEGYWLSAVRNPPMVAEDTSLERVEQLFLQDITLRYPHLPLYVREAQVQEAVTAYVRDLRTNGLITAATEYFGDSLLMWPAFATALILSENLEGNTYFYQIQHRPSISRHPDFIGSDHCDDLVLILGTQFTGSMGVLPVTLSEEDKIVAGALFTAWSNFVISGNPNSDETPQWPQFDSVLNQYMVFDVETHSEVNFQSTRMNFWRKTLPQLALTKVSDPLRGPIVETKQGRIQGKISPLNDASQYCYAFMGIPYASPPVDDLRFQPPQPAKSWKGIRDGTKMGMVCPQDLNVMLGTLEHIIGNNYFYHLEASEDCLLLDVYTPSLSGKRPVMVFIHGGGLVGGWSTMNDFRVYSSKHNIVGVAIQYRLGALGFMTMEDESITGNMGFKDQILALKWVQENIANFGGDPNQVTLLGESAGSWSVSLHLLSPLSKNLFKRVALMSGSVVGTPLFAPPLQPLAEVTKLVNVLGCPNTTSSEMVGCLMKVPARRFSEVAMMGGLFYPALDHECFTDLPMNTMLKGNFNTEVDILAGFCFVEGYMFVAMVCPQVDILDTDMNFFRECATGLLSTLSTPNKLNDLVDEAVRVYVNNDESKEHMIYAISKFVGDSMLMFPTYNTALKAIEFGNQKVFMYEYHGRPYYATRPEYIRADHVDDIAAAFGYSEMGDVIGLGIPDDKLEEARQTEAAFMPYLASFVKTGILTGEGLPHWPELREDGSYMRIDMVPELRHNYQPEQMKFWQDTVSAFQTAATKSRDEL